MFIPLNFVTHLDLSTFLGCKGSIELECRVVGCFKYFSQKKLRIFMNETLFVQVENRLFCL
jgi:hypothetical protein